MFTRLRARPGFAEPEPAAEPIHGWHPSALLSTVSSLFKNLLVYTATFIFIVAALKAQAKPDGRTTINFEYRVF